MKHCTSPEHEGPNPLPVSEFGTDRAKRDGLAVRCKACRARAEGRRAAAWRKETREERLRLSAARREEKREEVRRRWAAENLIPLGRPSAGLFAQVDDEDYELVMRYSWRIATGHSGVMYARRLLVPNRVPVGPGGQRSQYMHTLITGWPYVDHLDHDGLNNKRSNLREATHQQNTMNKRKLHATASRFKGVTRNNGKGLPWRARIGAGGHRLLGHFQSEEEAARAYDRAALNLFGEFACTNQTLGLLDDGYAGGRS